MIDRCTFFVIYRAEVVYYIRYMVTDELIRKEFVHQTMKYGIQKIYTTQQEIIAKHLNSVSGDLASWAAKAKFKFYDSELRPTYYISVLPYLRFLDINYRKGNDRISRSVRRELSLYNRVVWGVLYGETFPALNYGFRKEVQTYIRERLEASLPVDMNTVALLDDF